MGAIYMTNFHGDVPNRSRCSLNGTYGFDLAGVDDDTAGKLRPTGIMTLPWCCRRHQPVCVETRQSGCIRLGIDRQWLRERTAM